MGTKALPKVFTIIILLFSCNVKCKKQPVDLKAMDDVPTRLFLLFLDLSIMLEVHIK